MNPLDTWPLVPAMAGLYHVTFISGEEGLSWWSPKTGWKEPGVGLWG